MPLWRINSCGLLLGLVVAVVGVRCLNADEQPQATDDRLRRQIASLVGDLDADVRKIRMQARRELLKLGPRILPLLPPPERASSASVREDLRRIRVSLEQTKARESVRAARVTLHQTASLEELLKTVSSATGNPIDWSPLPAELRTRSLRVSYRKQPFWKVLDDLGGKAGFLFRAGETSESVVLYSRRDDRTPAPVAVTYSDAFRIAVKSMRLHPLYGSNSYHKLRVNLSLLSEPRLRPLFLRYKAGEFIVRSARGKRFRPLVPNARPDLPLGEGGRNVSLYVDFKVPVSQKVVKVDLKGNVTIQTAAGSEHIAFTKLSTAAGTSRRRGSVTVTLQSARFRELKPGRRSAHIRLGVTYLTGGPVFETHRTWIFHNRAYLETKEGLETKAGRRIERNARFHTVLQDDGTVAVEYNFDNLKVAPDDYRFVYVAPTLIINVPVRFQFTGIPVSPLNDNN